MPAGARTTSPNLPTWDMSAAATDTGHAGGSGSFALDANGRLNWQLIRDNASLGVHQMTVVSKALVASVVRDGAALLVLQRLFERRAAGPHGSAAIPGRLRRHSGGCAGNQLGTVPARGFLAAGRDARHQEFRAGLQVGPGDRRRRESLRYDRRCRGRRNGGPAALHVRSQRRSSGRTPRAADCSLRPTPPSFRRCGTGRAAPTARGCGTASRAGRR